MMLPVMLPVMMSVMLSCAVMPCYAVMLCGAACGAQTQTQLDHLSIYTLFYCVSLDRGGPCCFSGI